jgi:Xaa-Pro aminopeptidase
MKKDIDGLMEKNHLDAFLVTGAGNHNPYMVYLIGGGHITRADLIKKRGGEMILFHGSMERDEAAKTGLSTRSYSLYSFADLMKAARGDRMMAGVIRYQRMLHDAGVTSGRVALYGQIDLGNGYAIFSELQKIMPEITLVGFQEENILEQAMATKDPDEIERIRKMGKITTEVVGRVADYLTGHKVKGDVLIQPDGTPLTIRDVKGKINLWLSELGAENPEDTIFAIGRDSGVPHSAGNPTDAMRLGQTIVFDIYPCEAGGGYFYDFTRTWCLGYAPEPAEKLYQDVRDVHDTLFAELKSNMWFPEVQKRTCELFAAKGHPTVQEDPATETGYVHSVGHGIGLHVHELPFSGASATETEILTPGTVATIEPGLYYPDRGLGVRLEDSFAVDPDGKIEILADYPLDLVLPMKK